MIRGKLFRSALVTFILGAAMALPALQNTPLATPGTVHAATDLSTSPLRGDWRNVDAQTHSIAALRIVYALGELRMEVWGACPPALCDWGQATLQASPTNGEAIYHLAFAYKVVKVSVSNGVLTAHSHTHFTDGSGRPDYDRYDTFTKK